MVIRPLVFLLLLSVCVLVGAAEGDPLSPVLLADEDHDGGISAGDLVYCGGLQLRMQGQGPWFFFQVCG